MDLAAGRSLVRRWRDGPAHPAPASPGAAPVSAVQRGILVFERLRPHTPVFNLSFAARHTGPLDEARLDRALTGLVRRHPALRSTFSDGAAGPVRTVCAPAAVAVRWADLRDVPRRRREQAAREQAGRAAAEPFDIDRGPLVRVHGYRLGQHRRLLVFAAHHLVFDGTSMNILLSELDAAYHDDLTGVLPGPAPAPADPSALEHWRSRLAGLPDLDLPSDHARPAEASFRAGSVPLNVPADLVAAADDLARQENATTFMVVLAAFQLLLGRQAGQEDFAVGSPHAARAQPGQYGAVGLLSDLLVLRADLTGRPTFRELVRRSRATCLDAFAHRDVPFEDLVAALAPGRHVGGALVRASLVYHGERRAATLAGAPLEPVPLARQAIRHDVELHLWRDGGRLCGSWDYSADTFEPASAARMAHRLPVLLARALAEPDRAAGELDLLTDEERKQLARWSAGPGHRAPDVSLPGLFAAQAGHTPDAVAVRDSRQQLTYRRLDERSNQLAWHLRRTGAGPGDIVAIRLARSVDLIVAMLGILKAGAAYLPLDPAYPADRTDYMLRDSGARTVVTDAELRAAGVQPVSPVLPGVTPDQPAYVLYTSGSTGRPKGVLVTHRNAVPLVLWGRRAFSAAQLARVLAATSACFDVSVFEIFVPLCAGGAVIVVENALALLAASLDVTMICAVPSAVRALHAAGAIPPSVRAVGLAGEAITGTIADDLYATGHVEVVANLYGPTEDTTYSTQARLRPGEQPPPIGTLLPHGRGYVLDGALRMVPIGAVGELYLGGRGLTLGYSGQPGLTASRYLADPFAAQPGERMYRTGDLVRYRPDGALLYLGRRDFQVKIRGQRIELGEIETTLQRHPGVRDAVVTVHGERLAGYLTPRRPGGIDLDDVRAHLRRTLPVAMVPSWLAVLDALPLTPNGKVDRRALPPPDRPATTGGGPPDGRAEQVVAEVWRDVLRLGAISRADDFFDLGGDSLLAGKVLTGLRARTGADLSLRLLFEHTRLADLAAALPAVAAQSPAVVMPRDPGAGPVLSFEQQRAWLDSMIRPATAYNVHGRRLLRGRLDVAVLRRCVRAIIDRHDALRTSFPLAAGRPVPRVAAPGAGRGLRIADVSSAPDPAAAAARLADDQAAMTFDLAAGPLLDCLLIRQGDAEHLLSITIHHIVSDGWSIGLFVRELSALYQTGGDTKRAGLPALPVQYLDYAAWQRKRLAGARLAAQVSDWRDRLASAPPAVNLPVSRRRSPAQGAAGGRVRAAIGAGTGAALRRLCRDHDATPFMAIMAALAVLLRRWTAQDDFVIGVPVNTRGEAGVGAVIGFFVNTVPVRVRATGDPSFGELLDTVHEACLDGYVARGETPFDVLVRELHVVRDPSRSPLFQVQLSMIDTAEREWRLPGVEVTPCPAPPQPSKSDLNLDVHSDNGGYQLELSYYADRYDAAVAQAFAGQLVAVVTAAVADPGRGILQYELAQPSPPNGAPPRAGLTEHDLLAVPLGAADPRQRALAAGLAGAAALSVPDEATAAEPDELLGWLRDTAATAVYLTPPLLRALAAAAAGGLRLRHVFVDNSGDLTGKDVECLRRLVPGCRVIGVYHGDAGNRPLALYEVPAHWPASTAPLRVPIGVALHPVSLLGPAGQPAAVGEVAELCLGGRRSGDHVRRRPDGMVEFAAPPVDPLETVEALRDVAGVQDAVVTEHVDALGGTAMVAYVADPDAAVDLSRLRQHLITRLPEYQIPARIERLRRLPLTPGGRHDLTALAGVPVPGIPYRNGRRRGQQKGWLAPRIHIELQGR
jgi:amino acid adenylation domain-containing protein